MSSTTTSTTPSTAPAKGTVVQGNAEKPYLARYIPSPPDSAKPKIYPSTVTGSIRRIKTLASEPFTWGDHPIWLLSGRPTAEQGGKTFKQAIMDVIESGGYNYTMAGVFRIAYEPSDSGILDGIEESPGIFAEEDFITAYVKVASGSLPFEDAMDLAREVLIVLERSGLDGNTAIEILEGPFGPL